MKKPRFLALAALALAMTAANAQQAANDACAAVLNDPSVPSNIKQEVRQQQALEEAERLFRQHLSATTAAPIQAPPPDVKAQSCFEKFSNFKVVISLGYPTVDGLVDMLMNQLKNQACRVVDQQINNVTSGINGAVNGVTNGGNIPGLGNVGGNVGVSVGQGSAGSPPVDFKRQGNNVSSNLAGSVGNRIGQAANGIFR